ncbi:MAG: hypothetical protein IT376_12310 [Polyangiaceae bacterium]|nr:hypothetical protein [Polyangiaceae bacterium]
MPAPPPARSPRRRTRSSPRPTASASAAGLLALVASAGCRDTDRFDTRPGEAFCGALESAAFIHDGFVREGRPPSLRLRLRLDMDALDTLPGEISTDDTGGLCAPRALFEGAPLRAIEQLQHDQLHFLEFGDGRDQNFLAWADSTCQGTMLAVVSLMRSDDVEVRLLKPAPSPAATATAAERPGFALFRLSKQQGACGF